MVLTISGLVGYNTRVIQFGRIPLCQEPQTSFEALLYLPLQRTEMTCRFEKIEKSVARDELNSFVLAYQISLIDDVCFSMVDEAFLHGKAELVTWHAARAFGFFIASLMMLGLGYHVKTKTFYVESC